jgi:type IX secretion system PorP/SprF family membrane protein
MSRWYICIAFLLVSLGLEAQLEPLSDQYLLNTLIINPAYAGSREALSLSLQHRNQWTGFEGAPKTSTLAMHAPLRNEKVGLGFMFQDDRRGITATRVISGHFAYRIPMNQGTFSFGLGAGMSIFRNKWEELVAIDQDDALLRDNSPSYIQPNFSLGTYYATDRLFVGLSIPMFLSHNYNTSSGNFELVNDYQQYNYLLHGGYLFTLSPRWKILPSALIRYSPASKPQADLNSFLIFYDKFWLGFSYRSNKSLIGHLVYQVNNQLSLAYSYDMGLGKVGGYLGGSHEITLRYDFRYLIDVIDPRYF